VKPEIVAEHDGQSQQMLSHRIAADLRRAILSGELQPGTRIRQEELAVKFGTSRIPVREALWQLESEGLVSLVPNSGAWVAKLDLADCVEVYRIREQLEPLALSESIAKMSDAEFQMLESAAKNVDAQLDVLRAPGGGDGAALDNFLKLDREFHLMSYHAANMPRLYRMIEGFWNTTQQYRRAYSHVVGPDGHTIVHYEHHLLLEAIRRRDADGATRILFDHIRRTRLQLMQHKELF
jgi:DNA-binding GntR family transcriptional regulator